MLGEPGSVGFEHLFFEFSPGSPATAELNLAPVEPSRFPGTVDRADFESVALWFQKDLPPSPSHSFRLANVKRLLFAIFSVGDRLDYVGMLLALCKDDSSVEGLIKAARLVADLNVGPDGLPDERGPVRLPVEILYNAAIACLKNYTVNHTVVVLASLFRRTVL